MALKFWLGGAGSDKSRRLIKYILEEAEKNPDRQYLYVVPEQFGLATQRELVLNSRNCGILNIDVLSFTRLAHRISDEVGAWSVDVTTLDEMGKSLLIGMIAGRMRTELEVLGNDLDKLGFIDRIKSLISEFMQYGIGVERTFELSECAASAGRGLLAAKLHDIALVYKGFREYISDRYTTVEETLDMVSSLVPNSDTIRNSVVIFDGFTGFTPVQNKLIGVLMEYAKDIHVALLLEDCIQDNSNDPAIREHELFYLSKKTMEQLGRMADERRIMTEEAYKVDKSGLNNTCDNKNDIVYNKDNIPAKLNNTFVFAAGNPAEETEMVFTEIIKLVRNEGYRYRDIGILTGDLEGYRHIVERELSKHGIPFFIDRTEPVLLNPFMEYIRSFLAIFSDNYSISSVFSFLKTGLVPFSPDEINSLENYCLELNIKGYTAWHKRFSERTSDTGADELLMLDGIRERFADKCDSFTDMLTGGAESRRMNAGSVFTIKAFATALYRMIEEDGIEEQLKEAAQMFEEEGNRKLCDQYRNIYAKIMDVLDELCELIPDEKTDIRSFADLIDAGLDTIRIGTVPAGIDYVQVGDLTRSRFDTIRALFIVGANDGVIPKASPGSGMINENERDFLTGNVKDLVLAPTSKEDMFTQRLYIYMAMNRPEERLYVSYSYADAKGRALIPSYIIGKIKRDDPNVRIIKKPELPEYYSDDAEAFDELTRMIYPALSGTLVIEKAERCRELLRYFLDNEAYADRLESIIEKDILHTSADTDSIGKALAAAIYGTSLKTDITRLESYAGCAYAYFLKYGMGLKDRKVFSIDARDIGNIYHDCMKTYSDLMTRGGHDWADIEDDMRDRLMDNAVDLVMEHYMPKKLSSTARAAYIAERVRGIMRTSADVISAQVRRGKFRPAYFEVDFDSMESSDRLEVKLSEDEEMRLRGRIDRVDLCETDDGIYIRIIDYKSSGRNIDLAAVYEGRQLQLLVYLNVVMDAQQRRLAAAGSQKSVIPGGVLYYHIDDPLVDAKEALAGEDIHRLIMKELRLTGVINSDDPVPALMDEDIVSDPLVVPVYYKKDGGLKQTKQALSGEDIEVLSEYVTRRIEMSGREIISGNIAIPVPDGKKRFTRPDCEYCDYKAICSYKEKSPSDPKIKDKDMKDPDWIALMRS
ncbi:MAG: PD-(D/E)XK nuclease family protein [Lachnospiraceae bacterium]|nr:PD-(D/E)XK nuclease family protein [Lachnospiraceae bacterium]